MANCVLMECIVPIIYLLKFPFVWRKGHKVNVLITRWSIIQLQLVKLKVNRFGPSAFVVNGVGGFTSYLTCIPQLLTIVQVPYISIKTWFYKGLGQWNWIQFKGPFDLFCCCFNTTDWWFNKVCLFFGNWN